MEEVSKNPLSTSIIEDVCREKDIDYPQYLQDVINHAPSAINTRNPGGLTALHWTVLIRRYSALEILFANGADPRITDYEGQTALHYAATSGDLEAAQILLDCGSEVNAENRWGSTPLHLAARQHHFGVSELLLSFGARVDAEDLDKQTAIFMLLKINDKTTLKPVLQALLKSGSDINHRDHYGKTVLDAAVQAENTSMIQALHELGLFQS